MELGRAVAMVSNVASEIEKKGKEGHRMFIFGQVIDHIGINDTLKAPAENISVKNAQRAIHDDNERYQ